MTVRKSVSISLSPALHAVVERLLASGRYNNFSEVVRAGLRLLDEREQAFQRHNDTHSAEPAAPGPLSG